MSEKNNTKYETVFGRKPVLQVIENSNVQVNKVWLSERLKDYDLKEKIITYSKEKKIPFHIVPENKLISLTNNQNHQGIVLSISPVKYLTVKELIKDQKIILIAHEIEDTHNLGAMIRTFVSGSGKGIILTGRNNVGINTTIVKTSAGTVFEATFARATNCVSVLEKLKEDNFWIVGTDNSSESKSIYKTDFPEQIAIVVGNEHTGLGELIKKKCDFLVKVPIDPKVDSLNVSVAFGIVLFEFLRQIAIFK